MFTNAPAVTCEAEVSSLPVLTNACSAAFGTENSLPPVLTQFRAAAFGTLTSSPPVLTNCWPSALQAVPALLHVFAECASAAWPAVVALLAVRTLLHPAGFVYVCRVLCGSMNALTVSIHPPGLHSGCCLSHAFSRAFIDRTSACILSSLCTLPGVRCFVTDFSTKRFRRSSTAASASATA